MTFGIELLGALGLMAGGGLLLWHAFRGNPASRRSEKIVIDAIDPDTGS